MRYISKSDRLSVGQERIITKFLLFPKKIGKEIRWLERATIKQRVMEIDVGGSMEWGNYKNQWVDIEFID